MSNSGCFVRFLRRQTFNSYNNAATMWSYYKCYERCKIFNLFVWDPHTDAQKFLVY